jgi:hypothetical protein
MRATGRPASVAVPPGAAAGAGTPDSRFAAVIADTPV